MPWIKDPPKAPRAASVSTFRAIRMRELSLHWFHQCRVNLDNAARGALLLKGWEDRGGRSLWRGRRLLYAWARAMAEETSTPLCGSLWAAMVFCMSFLGGGTRPLIVLSLTGHEMLIITEVGPIP